MDGNILLLNPSFIHGLGKVSSLKTFFQHAAFISEHEYTGSLGDVTPSMQHLGFLSFARLVGTMYFKAHLDAFTYQSLYNSLSDPSTETEEQHRISLDTIRSTCLCMQVQLLLNYNQRMLCIYTGNDQSGSSTCGISHCEKRQICYHLQIMVGKTVKGASKS